MKYPAARILVFAKAPIPGQVKTRLAPVLTDSEAAHLHARLVRHTLATATQQPLCPVELWCAPDATHPFFQQCRQQYNITLRHQCEGDVGQRMEQALNATLQTSESAILIGTDCPEFTTDDLEAALGLLNPPRQTTTDAPALVLGPAEDGGYVLIGARRCHPSLFSHIEWGTDNVLATTRQRIQTLGWHWQETRTFWDLDRPEDWRRYQRQGKRGEVAAWQGTMPS